MATVNTRPENAEHVFTYREGGVWIADVDDVEETNGLDAELPASAKFLGIISDAGITQTKNQSVTDHRGYQGSRTHTSTLDEQVDTTQAVFMECNPDTLALLHGVEGVVDATTGETVFHVTSGLGKEYQLFLYGVDPNRGGQYKQHHRRVKVTNRGDRVFSATAPTGIDLTFTSYPVEVPGRTEPVTFSEYYRVGEGPDTTPTP